MLTVSILLTTLCTVPPASSAPPPTSPISLATDKQFYAPGDEVTIVVESKVEFQQGQKVEFSVLEGSRSGHVVEYEVHEVTEPGKTSMVLKFTLPEQSDSPIYIARIVVHNVDGGWHAAQDAIIYSKQGANILKISDFHVDKTEVVQGDYVEFSYKVVDGAGQPFFGAAPHIGICDDSSENMPAYGPVHPETPYGERADPSYTGCTLFYSGRASPSDSFNFKFGIPNSVEPGSYMLKVWASDRLRETAYVASALTITQGTDERDPANPELYWDVPFAQNIRYVVSENSKYPDFDDKFLNSMHYNQRELLVSPGQNITFFGHQVGGSDGAILGSLRWLHGEGQHGYFAGSGYENLVVRIYVVSPDGSRVFDREFLTDANGSFEETTFDITPDMPQGIYEIYYDVKTPDGMFLPVDAPSYDGVDVFIVSNLQRFKVDTSVDKTFDVYFQGIGMNASNLRFDEESKTLQLDIARTDGKYSNIHSSLSSPLIDCPYIMIEEPLLTGPFAVTLNGDSSWFCGGVSSRITNAVGPILEDSTVSLTGTYVIPEFGSLALIVVGSVSLMSAIILVKYLARRN